MSVPHSSVKSRTPGSGLAVAAAIAAGAWLLVNLVGRLPEPLGNLPVSMMLIAILAGLALAGVSAARPGWQPGLALARGPILKTAVALIGLRLSLSELAMLGWQALPLVLGALVIGLGLVLGLARVMRLSGALPALLAAGTAICGASAIAALAPGIRARPEEVVYAIACVALIGLLATLCYPLLLQGVLTDPQQVGLALGVSIHDTAQVTAAAAWHEQAWAADGSLNAATVAKLMRNLTMLAVIPALAWHVNNRHSTDSVSRPPLPLFILAFIALSALRSLGDVAFGADQPAWRAMIEWAGHLSVFGFAMAMAALAMNIRVHMLATLGWRPAAIAVTAAVAMLAWAIGWLS